MMLGSCLLYQTQWPLDCCQHSLSCVSKNQKLQSKPLCRCFEICIHVPLFDSDYSRPIQWGRMVRAPSSATFKAVGLIPCVDSTRGHGSLSCRGAHGISALRGALLLCGNNLLLASPLLWIRGTTGFEGPTLFNMCAHCLVTLLARNVDFWKYKGLSSLNKAKYSLMGYIQCRNMKFLR